MVLSEEVEQDDVRGRSGRQTWPVSLLGGGKRFRTHQRYERLRGLGLSVTWSALMAVTLLLVLVQWILLRPS